MMDGSSSSGQQQQMDLFTGHRHGAGGGMGMGLSHCETEDAPGSSESEPASSRPARPRGKRTRAAEVHNLSEKRRRCKINERLKALQSLVPNSSKTDKASMLDDAIDYLKQLQLQVQMLSMRNGLYLPPVNLPVAPEHLQVPPQMCVALAQNSTIAANHPVGLLPVNQISGAQHSYRNPLAARYVHSRAIPDPQFLLESSQPNLQSLLSIPSSEVILQKDVMLNHHLGSTPETTSVPDFRAATKGA